MKLQSKIIKYRSDLKFVKFVNTDLNQNIECR